MARIVGEVKAYRIWLGRQLGTRNAATFFASDRSDYGKRHYLSDDALMLILVSDRPGGFGGNDLYISTRKKLQ